MRNVKNEKKTCAPETPCFLVYCPLGGVLGFLKTGRFHAHFFQRGGNVKIAIRGANFHVVEQ